MNQIDPSDKIDAETEIFDYDDTLLEVLEMEPELTETFMESEEWE